MIARGLRARLLGFLWDHSALWRVPGRRVRAWWRSRGADHESIDERPYEGDVEVVSHPAIALHRLPGTDEAAWTRFLDRQTERSIQHAQSPEGSTPYVATVGGHLDTLPATHLEALLMATVAERTPIAVGGWTLPRVSDREKVTLLRAPELPASAMSLFRSPQPDTAPPTVDMLARLVAHPTGSPPTDAEPLDVGTADGVRILHEPVALAAARQRRVSVEARLDRALAALPPTPGPRTALFLLPYLAVGGAERQLLDVLVDFGDDVRTVVVTTEPHLAARGQMLDAFRAVTKYVYTLGDWLPRGAHDGAVRHLLRRYQVESLVSWNGTVLFYDQVEAWTSDFPKLRILHQIYNHEGGWIDHCGPRIRRTADVHFAVNRRIGHALVERGMADERIEVIHPAVHLHPEPDAEERETRKAERRAALGLPRDALVVASFIRLHPQKRPLDIIELARRFRDRGVHFLLVGGGPLDGEVDRALATDPPPNLTRLGLRDDVEALYEAVDICLMTSSFEGLPVFLLDGLARGIPCVTTAVGDIPLLLENGGGIAVERPGDLDGLAAAIESLRDPARRSEVGRAGRTTVAAQFEIGAFCDRYRARIFPESGSSP